MRRLKIGRGTEPDAELGPLIDAAQRSRVVELVEDAARRGARRAVVEALLTDRATFLSDGRAVDADDARLSANTRFGPAPTTSFASEEEAILAANDTPYGLVAYAFTRDINRAFRLVERLETGMVGVNRELCQAPWRRLAE